MKRTWTIIGVRDVRGSFKWYQSLFGQEETPPGHDYFGQILDTDGTILLCLHQWGAHEHPSLMNSDNASLGNGLLLFFRVDDYDMALKRARSLVARFEEESHVNPNTQTREFSLRDPDGYYVTISECSGYPGVGHNRSIPDTSVIPVLYYPSVPEAVAWLCEVLGFRKRLRIGDHRCQLLFGNGSLVVAEGEPPSGEIGGSESHCSQSVMVRVEQIDDLLRRAQNAGAQIVSAPCDQPYGERQCSFIDPWGRAWTLSQTTHDVDPAEWGGELLI